MKKLTALVTGSSRGLGQELCRQLVAKGFRVFNTSRSQGPLLDVRSQDHVLSWQRHFRRNNITLNVLINNAGILERGWDPEVLERMVATNVVGAYRVTHALLPFCTKDAHIIFVGSGLSKFPSSLYALTKEWLNSLAMLIASQEPTRRVNVVCPGWTRTAMGGPQADVSVEQGAAAILAMLKTTYTGGFYRDRWHMPRR